MISKEEYARSKIKQYYAKKKQNEILVQAYRKKRKEDVIEKVRNNIVMRIKSIMNSKGIKKDFTYAQLFGCNIEELKIHLENKFKDGMSWDNYGEWEVDHIKPISSFNLVNIKELFECCNYNNLQPLWKRDNCKKSNKIVA